MWIAPRKHSMLGAVVRQRIIEIERRLEYHMAFLAVDGHDDGGDALCAGIQPEIESHERGSLDAENVNC